MARPPRLRTFTYHGCHAYSLTMCTWGRAQCLATATTVELVLVQLLRAAQEHGVAILAYCFMPDHLHLLLQGLDDAAVLTRLAKVFRQRAAVEYRRRGGQRLWQPGYYERTLRREDDVGGVAAYIAANPVRAGLVVESGDWPFTGGELVDD
jgi:REP-associated tyrosine transposase